MYQQTETAKLMAGKGDVGSTGSDVVAMLDDAIAEGGGEVPVADAEAAAPDVLPATANVNRANAADTDDPAAPTVLSTDAAVDAARLPPGVRADGSTIPLTVDEDGDGEPDEIEGELVDGSVITPKVKPTPTGKPLAKTKSEATKRNAGKVPRTKTDGKKTGEDDDDPDNIQGNAVERLWASPFIFNKRTAAVERACVHRRDPEVCFLVEAGMPVSEALDSVRGIADKVSTFVAAVSKSASTFATSAADTYKRLTDTMVKMDAYVTELDDKLTKLGKGYDADIDVSKLPRYNSGDSWLVPENEHILKLADDIHVFSEVIQMLAVALSVRPDELNDYISNHGTVTIDSSSLKSVAAFKGATVLDGDEVESRVLDPFGIAQYTINIAVLKDVTSAAAISDVAHNEVHLHRKNTGSDNAGIPTLTLQDCTKTLTTIRKTIVQLKGDIKRSEERFAKSAKLKLSVGNVMKRWTRITEADREVWSAIQLLTLHVKTSDMILSNAIRIHRALTVRILELMVKVVESSIKEIISAKRQVKD